MARNVLYTALHDKTTKISVIKLKKKKKKTQTHVLKTGTNGEIFRL